MADRFYVTGTSKVGTATGTVDTPTSANAVQVFWNRFGDRLGRPIQGTTTRLVAGNGPATDNFVIPDENGSGI